MNNFWSHFKHFGRLLGKQYMFLTPSKTDGRVPSQQGAPTTAANWFTGKFLNRRMSRWLLASLGVVIGQNSTLQWGEGGTDKFHIAGILDNKSLQPPPRSFPSNTFLPRNTSFSPNLPANKNLHAKQILGGTDPSGTPGYWGSSERFLSKCNEVWMWPQSRDSLPKNYTHARWDM